MTAAKNKLHGNRSLEQKLCVAEKYINIFKIIFFNPQKRDFVELARVNPLKVWFGRNVNPDVYRIVIGYLEVVCALLLYAGPKPLKLASTAILLVVMVMMMQSLYWLQKPTILFAPPTVSSILLVLNFIILLGETPPKQKKKE